MERSPFSPPTLPGEQVTRTSTRNALGRGLGALIPGGETKRDLFNCPVDQIVPMVGQPRSVIDPANLQELVDSIAESGVISPVLLKREEGRYRLIAGERRWRAAKIAGLAKIPALVKEVNDSEAFALALIENVQRQDLTPIEEARACRRLIDEHGFTQADLARKLGKARSTVANSIRLLDLPHEVQDHVSNGRLSAGHARAVLSMPRERRVQFAARLVEGNLTVRQAEAEARPADVEPLRRPRQSKSSLTAKPRQRSERGASIERLERMLRETLHVGVNIVDRNGTGKIELLYDDDASLNAHVEKLLA